MTAPGKALAWSDSEAVCGFPGRPRLPCVICEGSCEKAILKGKCLLSRAKIGFGLPKMSESFVVTKAKTGSREAYWGASSLSFSRILVMSRFPCNTRMTSTQSLPARQ